MRNVAFGAWEDLLATLTDEPTGQGYTVSQRKSKSIAKSDPAQIASRRAAELLITVAQIFGWTAALLINVCIWGLLAYSSLLSIPRGLALTAAYCAALWWIASSPTSSWLSGALWPCIPLAVGAMGFLAGVWLTDDLPTNEALLCFTVVPEMATSLCLLRGVRRDPGRMTLFVDVFAGAAGALLLLYIVVFRISDGLYATVLGPGDDVCWSGFLVLLSLGLASVATFVSVRPSLGQHSAKEPWRWLAVVPVLSALGALGATTVCAFPLALAALWLFSFSIEAVWAVRSLAPGGGASFALGCVVCGLLGIAVVALAGHWLRQSGVRRASAAAEARCASDPPRSWSPTIQALLGSR